MIACYFCGAPMEATWYSPAGSGRVWGWQCLQRGYHSGAWFSWSDKQGGLVGSRRPISLRDIKNFVLLQLSREWPTSDEELHRLAMTQHRLATS